MHCIDDEGSPYELFEKPYAMPAKVVVEEGERPEDILATIESHYQELVEQFAEQELSRYYSRENRYEDGIGQPHFPIVLRDVSHCTTSRSTVVLPDGRRALLVDPNRVQTQCGVQIVMRLEAARQIPAQKAGTRLCPRCQGRHLPDMISQKPLPRQSTPPIPCHKCGADLRTSAHWDGPETLVCIPCGSRMTRPITGLTAEEADANESAIQQVLAMEPPESSTTQEEGNEDLELLDEESALHGDEECEENPDQVAAFDHAVSLDLLPETTALDEEELRDIHALLAAPETRFTASTQSSVVQHVILLTERRMVDPTDDAEFQTVLGQVVSEELGRLGDLIHAPACDLFKASHSPLRQTLVDRAIQNADAPDRRMAVWAAAGRLLQDTTISWLRDFRADIDPRQIPTRRQARQAFWADIRHRRKSEVQPLLEWMEQLDREDLALLAGDPDTTHPFVHRPDPAVFQDTQTLLNPLIAHLANELQRFRQKASGCQLLADDYGLDVMSLKSIAQQSGQWPPQAARPAVTH